MPTETGNHHPDLNPAVLALAQRLIGDTPPPAPELVVGKPRLLPWASIGHRLRFALHPWYILAGLAGAGYAANVEHINPSMLATAGPAVAGLTLLTPARWYGAGEDDGRRRETLAARRRRYTAWCTLAATEWAAAADATGLNAHSLAGKTAWSALLLGVPLLAVPHWRRYRIRPTEPAGTGEVPPLGLEAGVDELTARAVTVWAARVAGEKGVLPGTRLTDVQRIQGGWQARIVCDQPGSVDPDRFVAATRRIAAAYGVGVTDVSVEMDTADAGQAVLRIQPVSPLREVQPWPGPHLFDLVDGLAVVGRYADGSDMLYRFWSPTGPWHDLISGTTGSGKSELVTMLLLLERHAAGLVVSWVGDPQAGQSYTDLVEAVDWFAPDIDRIRKMVQAAEREMYRRNRAYGSLRWYDERRKVWRRGQKTWRPTLADPLLTVTIDEAHVCLKDPEIRRVVEALCKMGRKCGIKVRLITQVPLLTELGGSSGIRDAVASGNVFVFRTANALSGPVAFNGAIPADPRKIPREWPRDSRPGAGETTAGMGYALGVESRSTIGRTLFERDPFDWLYNEDGSPAGYPGQLDAAVAAVLGADYATRRAGLDQVSVDPPKQTASAEGTAVDAVLAFVARADGGRAQRKDIVAGLDYSARAVGKALTDLVGRELLTRVADGLYEVSPAGRETAALLAMVNA